MSSCVWESVGCVPHRHLVSMLDICYEAKAQAAHCVRTRCVCCAGGVCVCRAGGCGAGSDHVKGLNGGLVGKTSARAQEAAEPRAQYIQKKATVVTFPLSKCTHVFFTVPLLPIALPVSVVVRSDSCAVASAAAAPVNSIRCLHELVIRTRTSHHNKSQSSIRGSFCW